MWFKIFYIGENVRIVLLTFTVDTCVICGSFIFYLAGQYDKPRFHSYPA